MKRIQIFGLKDDFLTLSNLVESETPITLIPMGHSDGEMKYHSSISQIPNLGICKYDSGIACQSYLVFISNSQINGRTIHLIEGDEIVTYDQMLNENSVVFRPAGLFEATGEVFLGEISTIHDTQDSKRIMKVFYKAIRKLFTKHESYWIGDEAYKHLKAGHRLTLASQTPFSLKVPMD